MVWNIDYTDRIKKTVCYTLIHIYTGEDPTQETTPPDITCPVFQDVYLTPQSMRYLTITYEDPEAWDASGIDRLVYSRHRRNINVF